MKTVFSYYVNCQGHDPESELKLIALWRQEWLRRGFNPVVLVEWHARRSSGFSEFNNAVSQLPTVNSQDYERACFLRWAALADAGGGWMMDYDVFPNQFTALPVFTEEQMGKLQLMQANCVCPCLVHATPVVAMRLCNEFATGKYGLRKMGEKDHYSDQYALEDLVGAKADWIEMNDFVLGYGDVGWEKAQAVHFSNSSTAPRGKSPRWKHIPDLLPK